MAVSHGQIRSEICLTCAIECVSGRPRRQNHCSWRL